MRADGPTVGLAAGLAAAGLVQGLMISTVVGAVTVSWWVIPLHLAVVWLAGKVARGRGRNPNLGHALAAWFGVLGPLLTLGVNRRSGGDVTRQKISLGAAFALVPSIAVTVAFAWWALTPL